MSDSKKKKTYKIAVPKGALLDSSIRFLSSVGVDFQLSDRKLLLQTNHENVEILIVRPKDVAVFVEKGSANLGIVGCDVLKEEQYDVINLCNLNYGNCDLVIAVPKDSPIKSVSQIPDYSMVATKFIHLTREFFKSQGIPIEVIPLYGSIEIAPLTGLSEVIVDLVGTGKTLRENGLLPIHTISKHSARLICNRVNWQINNEWIKGFLKNMSESSK